MGNLRCAFVVGLVAGCAVSGARAGGPATFFPDHSLFTQYVGAHGKLMKGLEDFEESTAPPGSKTSFPNPLQHGVPRPEFDNGIDATNLIIQTNITQGPVPPVPNPSNHPNALWVNGQGFIGSNSIKVGTDEFLSQMFSSIDLIFTTHDKTAVGLDLSVFNNFNNGHNGFIVSAFDQSNNVLGVYNIVGPTPVEPSKTFIGVFSTVPIARVNVWGVFSVPEPFAVDNIEMWVPAPGGLGVLGMGAVVVGRRRRR